jgi:DNA-binding CsgD family transcriptional regulator
LSELLEREPEVEIIEQALNLAAGGVGRLVLVEAPAGLGKSTLLDAAREMAEARGYEVLAGRGHELEREFPFGVARQLFEARLRFAPAAERRRLLQGSAALVAELLGLEPPASAPRPDEGSPYPLLHGLHWLAANLAERTPLALVVDDAHWADELSLRFVVYLAARLADLPIAVVAARRPGERPVEGPLLAQLAAEPSARVLRPRPLSEPATEQFVAARAPGAEPPFVAACHHATSGNPFLLGELLGALEQEGVAPVAGSVARVREIGPEPVSRAVYLALRALAPEATAVARAVAVLGDGAPIGRVAALARISGDAAGEAVAALQVAGVLARTDGGAAFAHPIVGRAIYEELDAGERAAAHRVAVLVLRAADAPAERVAAHALKAGPGAGAEIVSALCEAAAEAMRRGAPRPAAMYLRRALAEPPEPAARPDVLAALGRAEAAAAEPAAADRLREAIETIAEGPERRATLAGELGNLLYARGAFGEAAATFDQALRELGEGSTTLHLSLEAGWAASALWTRSSAPEIRARVERFVNRDAEPVTRAERDLLANLAGLEMLAGESRGATARALRAWGDGALLEQGGVDDPAIWAVTAALAGSEAWDELAAVLDVVAGAASRTGAVLAHATAGYVRAYRWLCLGAVGDALAEIDRTLEARALGWGTFVPAALWVRVRCLLDQGDVDGAEAGLEVGREDEQRFLGSPLGLSLLDARARVLLARNQADAALETWRQAGAIAERMGVRNPAFFPWRSGAALAAARLGQGAEARRLADAEVEAARAQDAPRTLGVALTARGTVERPRAALPWLDEAVALLEGTPARLDLARALIQQGTVLRVAGRRVDARQPLRRGLDLADRAGALAVAVRAREELVAAGGRPRRTRLSGAEALTPSERRVAGLVVSGMSNREAAEALFVTKKAVEFHLGNLYRKLGVRSRAELGAALDGEKR